MGQSNAKIIDTRPAGPDHQVVSASGGTVAYRKKPCSDCPWRKDAVGVFPAEAFRHSASTAYDMSQRKFACHQSGIEKPATCAGFLLRGAEHNLSVRLAKMDGDIADDVSEAGVELHEDYRAMAIANGVDPDDDSLKDCR